MPFVKNEENRIKEKFSGLSKFYDITELFLGSLRDKVAGKVNQKNAKILDVACGTGSQSIAFCKKDFSVVGIDISDDMLAKASKKVKPEYKVKFINGNATKIPYKDSTFDVTSISFALHEMPQEIILTVLKEMSRVTKRNGKIIIVDLNRPKNPIVTWIAFNLCKIFEQETYDKFINNGLEMYLEKVGLGVISKESYFLDNVQIIECAKC